MSTSIDERVVQMSFDNRSFEEGAQESLSTLDKLKNALNFDGVGNFLENLGDHIDTGSLEDLGDAAENTRGRFSALDRLWDTVVTGSLLRLGGALTDLTMKLFDQVNPLNQVSAGWDKYAQKTTSVQTIMSATRDTWEESAEALGFEGTQMEFVEDQLAKLNWFTDETSYGFTDMVNNIGKFTNNGVRLEDAVTSMEGIATWAGLSGANVNEASRAMYNFSQAMGAGAMKLQDWKSIENANMATTEFKQTAIDTAVELGRLEDLGDGWYIATEQWGKKAPEAFNLASFSQQLSSLWMNEDVMTGTLEKFGKFTDELNALMQLGEDYEGWDLTSDVLTDLDKFADGYYDAGEGLEEFKKIAEACGLSVEQLREDFEYLTSDEMDLGRRAFKASQEAKTFQEAIDSVKDAASTAWMNVFEAIFGNYEEAKQLWTALANSLWNIFVAPVDALKTIMQTWKEFGGRSELFRAFGNIATAVKTIFGALKGESEEFDAKSFGQSFAEATKKFADFTEKIVEYVNKIEPTLTKIGEIFDDIFGSVFESIKTGVGFIFSLVIGFIKLIDLGSIISSVFSGISKIFSVFTDTLEKVKTAIKESEAYERFINLIDKIKEKFKSLFENTQLANAGAMISGAMSNFDQLVDVEKIVDIAVSAFEKFVDWFEKAVTAIKNFVNTVKESGWLAGVKSVFDGIKESITGLGDVDISKIWGKITESFANLGDSFEKLKEKIKDSEPFKKISEVFSTIKASIYDSFAGDMIEKLTSALSSVQEFFKSGTESVKAFVGGMTDSDAWKTLSEFVEKLWSAFANIAGGNFEVAFVKIGEAVATVKEKLESINIIDSLQAAFDKLKVSLVELTGKLGFGKLSNALAQVFGISTNVVGQVGEFVGLAQDSAWTKLVGVLSRIKESVVGLFEWFKGGGLVAKVREITDAIERFLESIISTPEVLERVKAVARGIVIGLGAVAGLILAIPYGIYLLVKGIINFIKEGGIAEKISTKIAAVIKIISGFLEIAKERISSVVEVMKNNPFLQKVLEFLQKVRRVVSSFIQDKALTVIHSGLTKIEAAFKRVRDTFTTIVDAIKNKDFSKISEYISSIKDTAVSFIKEALSKFPEIIEKVRTKFSELFEALKNNDKIKGVLDTIQSIKDVVSSFVREKILDKIAIPLNNIKTKLDELSKKLGITTALEKIGGFFTSIGEKASAAVEKVKGFIDTLKNSDVGQQLSLIFSKLKAGELTFGDITTLFAMLKQHIVDGINNVLNAFKETELYKKISEFLQNLGINLQNGWEGLDLSFLWDAAKVGSLAYIAIMVGIFIAKIVKGIGDLAKIPGAALQVLNDLHTVLKSYVADIRAQALIKVALAIAIMVGSVIALALAFKYLDPNTVYEALGVIMIVSAIVGALLLILSKFSNNEKKIDPVFERFKYAFTYIGEALKSLAKYIGMAAIILSVAVALKIIADAVAQLGGMDSEKAAAGFSRMMKLLLVLAGAVVVLSVLAKFTGKESIGTALLIVGLAAAMALLVYPLKELNDAGLSTWKGVLVMIALLGALAGAAVLVGRFSKGGLLQMIGVAIAAVGLAYAVTLLIKPIKELSDPALTNLGPAVGAIALLLVAFGAAAEAASGTKATTMLSMAVSIIAFAIAIRLLVKPLKDLSEVPVEKLAPAALTLAGIVAAFALAALIAGGNKRGSGSMGLMALALDMLAVAAAAYIMVGPLEQIGSLPTEKLIKAVLTLGSIILAFGASALIAGGNKRGSGAMGLLALAADMIAIGFAAAIMADPLDKIGSLEWDQIGKAALILVGTILAFGAAALIAGGNKMGSGTGGLLALAADMIAIGIAAQLMAGPIERIGELDANKIQASALMFAGIVVAFGLAALMANPYSGKGGSVGSGTSGLLALAADMIAIGIAAQLMAGPFERIGALDTEKISATALALAGIIVAFGMAALIASPYSGKGGSVGSGTGGLLALAADMIAIGIAAQLMEEPFETIGMMPLAQVQRAAGAIAGIILAFGGAALIANLKGSGGATALFGLAADMIAVGIAANLLVEPLGVLGAMPFGQLAQGALSIASIIIVLGLAALSTAKVGGGAGATALFGLAADMIAVGIAAQLMAGPLEQLSVLPFADLLQAVGAIAGIIVAFGLAALIASPYSGAKGSVGSGAGGLLALAADMIAVGIAAQLMADPLAQIGAMPMDQLLKSAITVVAIIAMLGLAAMIGGGKSGLGLLGLAASLIALAVAINMINNVVSQTTSINWVGLIQVAAEMAIVIGGVVLGVQAIGAAGVAAAPGLLAVAGAMVAAGIGVSLLTGGFDGLAGQVEGVIGTLTEKFEGLTQKFQPMIDTVTGAVNTVKEAGSNALGWIGDKIGSAKDTITGWFGSDEEIAEAGSEKGQVAAEGFANGYNATAETTKIDPKVMIADSTDYSYIEDMQAQMQQYASGNAPELKLDVKPDLNIDENTFTDLTEMFSGVSDSLNFEMPEGLDTLINGDFVGDIGLNLDGLTGLLSEKQPELSLGVDNLFSAIPDGITNSQGASIENINSLLTQVSGEAISEDNIAKFVNAGEVLGGGSQQTGTEGATGITGGFENSVDDQILAVNTGLEEVVANALETNQIPFNDLGQTLMGLGETPETGGTAGGMIVAGPQVTDATNTVITDAAVAAQNDDNKNLFKTLGQYLGEGLAEGISESIGPVSDAIDALCAKAEAVMALDTEVKSPSRLYMWYGNMIGEGLAIGIEAKTGRVGGATGNIVSASMSALEESLRSADAMLSDSLNPTITPVLDLSEVRNGTAMLDGMLNSGYRYNAMASSINSSRLITPYGVAANGTNNETVTNNFNINVTGGPNASARDIANEVMDRINNDIQRRKAAFA